MCDKPVPSESEWADALGSKENPLTERDFPFTVPVEGRYWIVWMGGEPVETPVAPEGSVLEVSTGRNSDGL